MTDQGKQIVVRANYEIFVIFLTILQVMNSFLFFLLHKPETSDIPRLIAGGVSLFLMSDAAHRLWKASDRRRFLFHFRGYLILLGSLPIPFAALLRLAWYGLLSAHLRRSDYANMENVVIRKRAQSAMLGVLLATVLMLEISSILIVYTEASAAGSNIKTAGDALWWSLVTMATVGYGDKFPVTTPGRVIAIFVMIVGVGIFTVLTSFLTQSFTRPRRTGDQFQRLGEKGRPDDASAHLEAIRRFMDEEEEAHQIRMQEIRTRLDALASQLAERND